MKSWKNNLLDTIRWSEQFLIRSDLRSLRNFTLLRKDDRTMIFTRLTLSSKEEFFWREDKGIAYEILRLWERWCEGDNEAREVLAGLDAFYEPDHYRIDDYAGVYFSDGTLSARGFSLRLETRTRQPAD